MKRKTSTVPTRIWTFGCRPPTEGAELARDQLKAAHRYYNKLVEIELERRRRYRAARSDLFPEILSLESEVERLAGELEAARDVIKKERQKTRTRSETPIQKLEVEALRARLKVNRDELKKLRAAVRDSEGLKTKSDAIQEWSYQAVRDARAACGVFWGTYLLVEKAADAMRRSKVDPRFHRFDGGGRIGVHLNNGISMDELFGCENGSIRLEHVDKQRFFKLHLRAGSNTDKRRSPIFITFPVLLHRQPPANARLKDAWVVVRRQGLNLVYELQLVLESPDFVPTRKGTGVVALDIGWRWLSEVGEVRVGYLVDEHFESRELRISKRDIDSFDLVDRLRGYGDRHFNHAREAVIETLGPMKLIAVPNWLQEACDHIEQWRSRRRLVRLAQTMRENFNDEKLKFIWLQWKAERLAAGFDLFAPKAEIDTWLLSRRSDMGSGLDRLTVYLDLWRRKDAHLYQWERNAHMTTIRRRRDLYRNWAARLAGQYETVVMARVNLAKIARLGPVESDTTSASPSGGARFLAAPGELRAAILHAFGEDRVEDFEDPTLSTRCHVCGEVDKKVTSDGPVLVSCPNKKCSSFDLMVDRDKRACQNLLKDYRERFPGKRAPKPRVQEGNEGK